MRDHHRPHSYKLRLERIRRIAERMLSDESDAAKIQRIVAIIRCTESLRRIRAEEAPSLDA